MLQSNPNQAFTAVVQTADIVEQIVETPDAKKIRLK